MDLVGFYCKKTVTLPLRFCISSLLLFSLTSLSLSLALIELGIRWEGYVARMGKINTCTQVDPHNLPN